jgi:hypothetical protein
LLKTFIVKVQVCCEVFIFVAMFKSALFQAYMPQCWQLYGKFWDSKVTAKTEGLNFSVLHNKNFITHALDGPL